MYLIVLFLDFYELERCRIIV